MTHSTRKLGTTFTWLGWIIGFFLLALLFDKIINHQQNPNQVVQTVRTGSHDEIVLQQNRSGHYLFNGHINGKTVTFLVDTGATMTSIPEREAARLGLRKGRAFGVQTANGSSTAYSTRVLSLMLGDIEFHDVRASLNPGLNGSAILLGMNILKKMELIQRGDTLILRRLK